MNSEYLAFYAKHTSEIDFFWEMDDEELTDKLINIGFNKNEVENQYIPLQREYFDLLDDDLKKLWEIVSIKMAGIAPNAIKKRRSKCQNIYKMGLINNNKLLLELRFEIDSFDGKAICKFGIWTKGGKAAATNLLQIFPQDSWSILTDWNSGSVVHNDILISEFMDNEQKFIDLQKLAESIVQPFRDIDETQWKNILAIANPQ